MVRVGDRDRQRVGRVDGKLVGGADIVRDLHQRGQLGGMLGKPA